LKNLCGFENMYKYEELIPFNAPYLVGTEYENVKLAHQGRVLSGGGVFTKKCTNWLERQTSSPKVILTHSCTAALEMMALLLDLGEGDEIIMPSYTFVSTANAFAIRGCVPVFVDIREDTLNIDENLIELAITPRTRAIVVVHYAGVSCEMDAIMSIAKYRNLVVLEDSAQGMKSYYKGRALGGIGHLGAFSFHETKNISSGEGGALLVRDPELQSRADIILHKGTNRTDFSNGLTDKYTWVDIGSSYLPSEITAAFLWSQLECADLITEQRLEVWNRYHVLLEPLEAAGYLRRPIVPSHCKHNGHIYYILLKESTDRSKIISNFKINGINAPFHYVPLHSSPGGRRYGRACGNMAVTDMQSARLVRLPIWMGLSEIQQEEVVRVLLECISS
jgi:dTDP-4-amino-4,6-dideoxygalactose transaminase